MADRERETRSAEAALARLIRDNPGADAAVLAHECVMALDARGWRYVIERPPAWARGGGGLPTPDSDAARALADVRARFEERTSHG